MSNKPETVTNHLTDAHTSNASQISDRIIFPEEVQTIKAKNPKVDFNKAELLKLLCYMEGELQARDVVIAVLKSEKVKNLVNVAAYGAPIDSKLKLNDPHAALFRDSIALTGNLASRTSAAIAAQSELDAREFCEQQLLVLSQKVDQQRQTHAKVVNLLKSTRDRHLQLMQELDTERKKNEEPQTPRSATCEKSRLQDKILEAETARDQLVKDVKKLRETLEAERVEHKEIVFYLLEERKKINIIRNEERKRSEDLAQILSEEKQRVDTIADGLEEETKKSLRLEAEMEKQSLIHEQEKKLMLRNLATEEKKIKDLEAEVNRLRMENEALKKSTMGSGGNPMMSNVSKIIQPTATVSSVPVSGPTTGIARSISPGQVLRHDSSSSMTSGTNVATIIRAHSVQQSSSQGPQPPLKKGQFTGANSVRAPPPIPPNKPIINKGNATTATTSSSRISFLQSQTVSGIASAAQAIAAQNAKSSDE
ncbi:CLUMA_CG007149, isoform A [Clunio marinus]|uniref:CLUMA_CG007149, isoform A n=1 Tax=Clunio marinus TaxID=568069 RepID=A0A1J1I082_9DIPT|nr:CLUMA_CG007149, isoform A [Clunio marinus]